MRRAGAKRLTGGRFVAIVLLTVVAVILMTFLSQMGVHNAAVQESEQYLSDLSKSLTNSINYQLESSLNALESMAIGYGSMETEEGGGMNRQSLQERAELLGFVHVFVVEPDGTAVSSDGVVDDFSNCPEIMSAFQGHRVVTRENIQELDESHHQAIFALAVPIYEQGRVNQIMTACVSQSWTERLMEQSYFGGEIFFHVVRNNGEMLIRSKSDHHQNIMNDPALETSGNLFVTLAKYADFEEDWVSLEALRACAEAQETVEMHYTFPWEGVEGRTAILMPLGRSDLNLWLVMVGNAAREQSDLMYSWSMLTSVFIVIVFLVLSFTLYRLYNHGYQLAYVDSVTGGYSLARFEEEGRQLLNRAASGEYMYVSVNIDKFKLINEIFGQEQGDKMLRYVYEQIHKMLKEDELVCRTSSDHFDVLMHTLSQADTVLWYQRLVEEIGQGIKLYEENLRSNYVIGLSFGAYRLDDPTLPFVIFRDRAVMARKHGLKERKNHLFTYGFYSESKKYQIRSEKEMENRMEEALQKGHFKVYFQPKEDLCWGGVAGAEALVRWHDPEWGVVPPNDFIPFFEQNGFIRRLDLYMFEQVCKHLARWRAEGRPQLAISVNLCRLLLEDEHFLEPYVEILQRYQVPASCLEFEITESVVNKNTQDVIRAIDTIHRAGFTCSLDDFGSGYSSLNIIQDLHVDVLKIDKAFFRTDNIENPREQAVIREVVHLAKALHMGVCAEGVETEGQAKFLREIHCNMGQGYLFSKPLPVEEFEVYAFEQGRTVQPPVQS